MTASAHQQLACTACQQLCAVGWMQDVLEVKGPSAVRSDAPMKTLLAGPKPSAQLEELR